MNTTYSKILAQARREAARYVNLPASESEALQGYLNEALRAAWFSAPWPGILRLEELTPASRLVDRRIGETDDSAPELAQVLGVYDGNPRVTTGWDYVEFEEDGESLVLLDDLATVWVDYLPPAPELLLLAGSALDNFEIDVRFRAFMAYSAAARLVRGEGTLSVTASLNSEAEAALAIEQGRFTPPQRLMQVRMRK